MKIGDTTCRGVMRLRNVTADELVQGWLKACRLHGLGYRQRSTISVDQRLNQFMGEHVLHAVTMHQHIIR